jgi:hypothetical protein
MGLLLLWYLRFNRRAGSAGRVGTDDLDEGSASRAAPRMLHAVERA